MFLHGHRWLFLKRFLLWWLKKGPDALEHICCFICLYEVYNVVTCLLKAQIAEPEEMDVARQWLCKHTSTATRYACSNRKTVVSSVFCGISLETIWWGPQPGCANPSQSESEVVVRESSSCGGVGTETGIHIVGNRYLATPCQDIEGCMCAAV
jgi:hypothetical protein